MSDVAVYNMTMSVIDEVYDITIADEAPIDMELSTAIQVVNTDVYEGPYTVTPKMFEGVTLETKDKTMSEDVTVLEVPYFEVSNPSGGTTVYIAMEVN